MSEIKILDACCGSRLFWFDKNEEHTIFMDIRQETFKPLFGQQRGTTHWMTFMKFELTGNGG
ncbi:hypothetical protein ACG3JJ_01160 [Streptococcus parauberis]|uniref:hypothetical protein n=1 Tax=Streptococcus parauberis TaxID=1348 RepID=UPI000306A242|nr:hypothetical protein [Streptococcus parauberis]QBX27436.1 putative methyltransferase [Streptococcus phage Javan386]UWM90931.1 hypothetical protein N2A94_10655 [Streptococcus parauberis]